MDQLAEKQKEIDRLRAALIAQLQKNRALQFDGLLLVESCIHLEGWSPFLKCEFYIENMEDAHRFIKQYTNDSTLPNN